MSFVALQVFPKDPFHQPTAIEKQEIVAQIARNILSIEAIDEEIQKLLRRRRELEDHSACCVSILAPVRRLTFDVLACIFHEYVHSYRGDPWILAHVSRSWRTSALALPGLWSGIHVELDPTIPGPPHSRRLDGREYCSNDYRLDLALRRSSRHPLDLKIASPPAIPQVVRAHITKMLHMVLQHMYRWRSLEIEGAIGRLPGLNAEPLGNLESLTLHTRDKSMLSLINETATRLTSFTNTRLGLENFEPAVWWPTLRSLDLTIPVDSSLRPQTTILMQLLSRAESLENLSLDYHQMQPLSMSELVTLPKLRTLALYDIPILLPFHCPNLVQLRISVGKERPVLTTAPLRTPATPIHLPHLTRLIFEHPNLAVLSSITAPALDELVISPQVRIIAPQYNDNAFGSIWNEERRQKGQLLLPRVLRLEDIHVSATSIQRVVRYMSGLQSLEMKWLRTDHLDVLRVLIESTSVKNAVSNDGRGRFPAVCPSLKTLSIYDASTLRSGGDTKSMRNTLETLVRTRRELEHPLKSVRCRWPQDSEMEEFII